MALNERLESAKREAESLKSQLEQHHSEVERSLEQIWNDKGHNSPAGRFGFQVVRRLTGHHGKISALHWGDDTRLVSASQDGKMFVWNALLEAKTIAVNLKSPWVMACGYEQEKHKFVAAGGLDNACGIYTVGNAATATISEPTIELTGHEGYLSCCRFVNGTEILTSSGDSNCFLWDVNTAQRKAAFSEHAADVMGLAVDPNNPSVFCSASCDSTVRVWDVRASKPCTHVFYGHDSDVNSVDFFSNGQTIASGSDDSTCRLFDLRTRGTIAVFSDRLKTGSCVTSVALSRSGSLLFAGYEDHTAVAWETTSDTMKWHELGQSKAQAGGQADPLRASGHTSRVSCLGLNTAGNALATGSWDQTLLVWSQGEGSLTHH